MKIKKFIVCGASRAGKSILSQRILEQFKVSCVVGDALVTSFEEVFPEIGISHESNEEGVVKLEEYIKTFLYNYEYEGVGYVFDSTHLRPCNIVNIYEKIGKVPTVFLGYADINVEEKFKQIRKNDLKKDFWSFKMSDDELREYVKSHIERSRKLREECAQLSIPYFDTGSDFNGGITEAFQYLSNQVKE